MLIVAFEILIFYLMCGKDYQKTVCGFAAKPIGLIRINNY